MAVLLVFTDLIPIPRITWINLSSDFLCIAFWLNGACGEETFNWGLPYRARTYGTIIATRYWELVVELVSWVISIMYKTSNFLITYHYSA